MFASRPPRMVDLVDMGDGVSWAPYDDASEMRSSTRRSGGSIGAAMSYRMTAERRIERRKRPRPRPLDVSV